MEVVILISVLEMVLFIGTIKYIQRKDKQNRIILSKKKIYIVTAIIIGFTYALFIKYGPDRYFFTYSILGIMLIIESYIDLQTKDVYRFINHIGIGVGLLLLVTSGNIFDVTRVLIQLGIYSLFIVLQLKLKMYGTGDGYVFIMTAIFLSIRNPMIIETGIIHMLISTILHELINIKYKITKSSKKEKYPFVPSIGLSTFLMIMIL